MGDIAVERVSSKSKGLTFARAKLWLGMVTVASLVAASSLLLLYDVPGSILGTASKGLVSDVLLLAGFVLLYVSAHAVSDYLGAVVIPHRFRRQTKPKTQVIKSLTRGVIIHALGLWVIAAAIMIAGGLAGFLGVVLTSATIMMLMLLARGHWARAIGGVRPVKGDPTAIESDDPGFTGGINGILRPTSITIPTAWRKLLNENEIASVLERRRIAGDSKAWLYGRLFALAFTILGVSLAAFAAGTDSLGTPAGVIRMSLWFTLWSFLGLITLPTLSRNAIAGVDSQLPDSADAESALRKIDAIGDDEPTRSALIESIFHPIPKLESRKGPRPPKTGFWDVARTALFLSPSGLGLLSRSVHCNCGRPALWVYLPSA